MLSFFVGFYRIFEEIELINNNNNNNKINEKNVALDKNDHIFDYTYSKYS